MTKLFLYITEFYRRTHDTFRYIKTFKKYTSGNSFFKIEYIQAIYDLFHPGTIILFYPQRPVSSSILHKLCAVNRFTISNSPAMRYHLAFKNQDSTFFNPSLLDGLKNQDHIINKYSLDISKNKVSKVFYSVFGYNLEIDPLTFNGPVVEKSDTNAQHDGRVVMCPLLPKEIKSECVYQKVIDNTVENNLVMDYRVPVHGVTIPLVYLKYRSQQTRFSNKNDFVKLVNPDSVLNKEEQKQIILFAQKMGIDYGELDVLRDNKDQKIYIVDANMTPWGPPNGLPKEDQQKALFKLKTPFAQLVQKHLNE